MTQVNKSNIRDLVDYNKDTGVFTYKARTEGMLNSCADDKRWNSRYAGKVAGFKHSMGYISISIYGKQYLAHQLAFLYMHGYSPELIDHKDQNKENNRIDNLREATKSNNACNSKIPSSNNTGVKGVGFHKKAGKYRARIMIAKKEIYLGLFDSVELAAEAVSTARDKHHGEFSSM